MGAKHKRLYRGSCLAGNIYFTSYNNVFTEQRQKPSQSCKWFMAALILLGLMRLNQAVYCWFHIENSHQSDIVGPIILQTIGAWQLVNGLEGMVYPASTEMAA